MKSLWFDPIRD